jgi:hypothetical protein
MQRICQLFEVKAALALQAFSQFIRNPVELFRMGVDRKIVQPDVIWLWYDAGKVVTINHLFTLHHRNTARLPQTRHRYLSLPLGAVHNFANKPAKSTAFRSNLLFVPWSACD